METEAINSCESIKGSRFPSLQIEIKNKTMSVVLALFALGLAVFLGFSVGDFWARVFGISLVFYIYFLMCFSVKSSAGAWAVSLFMASAATFSLLFFGVVSRFVADFPSLLLLAAVLILTSALATIFRLGASSFKRAFYDYGIALASLGVLAFAATLIAMSAYLATPEGESFRAPFLQSLSASFLEDIVFFSLLGFLLLLLQRRYADLDRNLDDKIELLFSAKRLRSGEAAYLREQVRTIAADCVEHVTHIDVVDYDEEKKLVQLDVSRQFYVGNYLDSETAKYVLRLDISAEPVDGHDPAMHVFPTIVNSASRIRGEWQRLGDDEILESGGDLASGEEYRPEPKHLDIDSGQIREFRTRFQAWHSIFTTSDPEELDVYELTIRKHWDEVQMHLRNSLKVPITVTISGRETRKVEMLPGDEHRKAYRTENLSANSKIDIKFQPD